MCRPLCQPTAVLPPTTPRRSTARATVPLPTQRRSPSHGPARYVQRNVHKGGGDACHALPLCHAQLTAASVIPALVYGLRQSSTVTISQVDVCETPGVPTALLPQQVSGTSIQPSALTSFPRSSSLIMIFLGNFSPSLRATTPMSPSCTALHSTRLFAMPRTTRWYVSVTNTPRLHCRQK